MVITGMAALSEVGIAPGCPNGSVQAVGIKFLDNKWISNCKFFYLPDVANDTAYLSYMLDTRFGTSYVPNVQRAIVDNIRYSSLFDSSAIVEALKNYLLKSDGPDRIEWTNLPEEERFKMADLYEVARHYNAVEQLEYWIQQAREEIYEGR